MASGKLLRSTGSSVWCSVMTQWAGMGGGEEAQEGGDICIHMTGSQHCTAESNTTLKQVSVSACVVSQSLQSCPTLCNPVDCSPPGFSVHAILQARILEWVAMPSSRGPSRPRVQTHLSCLSCIPGTFFTTEPPGKPLYFSKK